MTKIYLLGGIIDETKMADYAASQIRGRTKTKYHKQFPFFSDMEFEDVTKGVIPIPDNKYCLTGCRNICCPEDCCFFSEKLDSCGIYEYRSISCRLSFCKDMQDQNVLKKVHNTFCSETACQFTNDVVENEFHGRPSPFGRLFDSAKEVEKMLESNRIPQEEAKSKWKNIIQEYRNRKI
ncbi:MAG: hypothetical protein WA139_02210 [Candidatus Aenigmatarchaeota archaeon]